ncbi:hypothetical protein [Streptomyces sp. NBC_01190]|uniref:hypothetical protein n=1 Tax=Streptomyces sp. NBC_01190 TaxID=2903767 RepID=UPI0038693698|nr:hypothetical protein OG519_07085 [Streptomyces sp. NBC_01190]
MAELPERLREAADAHRPDRARILARVERAIGGDRQPAEDRRGERPTAPWTRIAAVTAAAAGVIGIGGLAVGAVSDGADPGRTVVTPGGPGAARPTGGGGNADDSGKTAVRRGGAPAHHTGRTPAHHHKRALHKPGSPTGPTPARSPGPSRTSGIPATPVVPTSPAPPTGPASPTGPATPAVPVSPASPTGPATTPTPSASGRDTSAASSAGAVDAASTASWSQSDVRLTVHQELTVVTVELWLARAGGVAGTGSFCSAPGRITASVQEEGDFLVYRWTLDPGLTLAAGTYTFAGQFDHAPGQRDTSGDAYAVAAVGRDGPLVLGGGF